MDANWGIAVGGAGVGFGFFMLRSAAVVWTNGRKGNGNNNKYVEKVEYKATSEAIFNRLGAVEKRTDEIYKLLLEGRR